MVRNQSERLWFYGINILRCDDGDKKISGSWNHEKTGGPQTRSGQRQIDYSGAGHSGKAKGNSGQIEKSKAKIVYLFWS